MYINLISEACDKDFCNMQNELRRHLNDRSFYNRCEGHFPHQGWTIVAKIQYTVMTHKSPGQVSLRIIHGCARNPFRSLARVLTDVLGNQLEGVQHICHSSIDFKCKISKLRVGPTDRFCRLDLEDFYMASGHDILTKHAFGKQTERAGNVLREALSWLLKTQCVRVPMTGDTFYVRKGSGMGSVVSGALCDYVLYVLGERDWAVNPKITKHFGIKTWLRYRDDVFIIHENFSRFMDSLEGLGSASKRPGASKSRRCRNTTW